MLCFNDMIMALLHLLSLFLIAKLSLGAAMTPYDWPTGKKCPKAKGRVESCVCDPGNNGTFLDLSPLASPTGLPR